MLKSRPRQRSSGVEQLIRNQQVVSSNLTVGSIFFKNLRDLIIGEIHLGRTLVVRRKKSVLSNLHGLTRISAADMRSTGRIPTVAPIGRART